MYNRKEKIFKIIKKVLKEASLYLLTVFIFSVNLYLSLYSFTIYRFIETLYNFYTQPYNSGIIIPIHYRYEHFATYFYIVLVPIIYSILIFEIPRRGITKYYNLKLPNNRLNFKFNLLLLAIPFIIFIDQITSSILVISLSLPILLIPTQINNYKNIEDSKIIRKIFYINLSGILTSLILGIIITSILLLYSNFNYYNIFNTLHYFTYTDSMSMLSIIIFSISLVNMFPFGSLPGRIIYKNNLKLWIILIIVIITIILLLNIPSMWYYIKGKYFNYSIFPF